MVLILHVGALNMSIHCSVTMPFHICVHFLTSNQKVSYKTKRPMFDLRTIAEVEGAGVKAGKHAEWREQIIVPPLPQSALAGCSLIDIEYFIQVRLCLCLFSNSPKALFYRIIFQDEKINLCSLNNSCS